jgi:Ca2+-dependent lipid-binding protein
MGSLLIEIISGKISRNTETFGYADPYVCIEYRKIKYKTKVHEKGGYLPKWNEYLTIPI